MRYSIRSFTRYTYLFIHSLMLDPIFNHLISIGYTNITKHPIPSTNTIITPQTPTTTTENLLPTMTPLPETTLLLIAEPTDSTTTLLTYHHLTKQIYTFSPSTSTLTLSSPSHQSRSPSSLCSRPKSS